MALFGFGGIELSNIVYDSTSTAFDAWEWTNAIAAPAALVAGKLFTLKAHGHLPSFILTIIQQQVLYW